MSTKETGKLGTDEVTITDKSQLEAAVGKSVVPTTKKMLAKTRLAE